MILLHEFEIGHSAKEAWRNVSKSKGEDVVSCATAKRWFKKFKEGQEDKEHLGRPPAIDMYAVLAKIESDPTMSTRMLAKEFECSYKQIARILHEAGKQVRKGRWVPHKLTQNQKNRRNSAAQELLERHNKSPFLNRIVTCDEKWVSYKNPVNKKQWLTPGQPSVSTPKPDWRQRRILLCVWWWRGGVIHWETFPNGQTITAQYYCSQLDCVYQKIRSPGLAGHFRAG